MTDRSRRQFLEIGGVAVVGIGMPFTGDGSASQTAPASPSSIVYLAGDGLNSTPSEAVSELARLCATEKLPPDEYGLGGSVEDVERYFARLLGKERALFMPTGTLANHLAIRGLARDRRRVIVQDVSHLVRRAIAS